MYKISRLLLIGYVVCGSYSIAILSILGWPWVPLAVGFIIVAVAARQRRRRLTTLGSARWAEDKDLLRSGMLAANSGLILGRLPRKSGTLSAISWLLNRRVAAIDACWEFLVSMRRNRRGRVVRMPNAIHTSVFSPSGGGKGVSCVVPFLMTCPDSCVVVDFKGENAKLTAAHRQKQFGHRIVMLDPFKVVTQSPDRFNPVDFVTKTSSVAIDECNDIANALVLRTAEEKEPHWNDSAEAWIAAVLATVVQYGEQEQGSRSLQTVSEILSDPQKLELALKLMGESAEPWGGMLARMGGQLRHSVDKEKASTLTTVARHLRFLTSVAVADSTKSSTFDPNELRSGKVTIYLVLPPEHMRAQSALLRLWIGSLLRACIRGGLQEAHKVHFILDEAASLGHLEAIDDAVDKYRGYGIRLLFIWQSLGQLKKCFPEGQDQTLLSNTSQVFFGVNDSATAEFVSARMGEETIIVTSGGTSTSRSHQQTMSNQPQTSSGTTHTTNSNWNQVARKLLKPEEIMQLPPRGAITFAPGVPPIYTELIRYYEEKRLGRRPNWFLRMSAACFAFTAASVMFLLALFIAIVVTLGVNDAERRESQAAEQATAQVFQDQ